MSKMIRTYKELLTLDSFEERFEYLKLDGRVGESTFGFDRYISQNFYHSDEWKEVRRKVIIRDNGNDLGIEGREIVSCIHVHHMNPIIKDNFKASIKDILNPDFLISTSSITHKAIHYGNDELLLKDPIERFSGDTKLW